MSGDEISARIKAFIRESFLEGDTKEELEANSPLLEWGVLNSMNTAVLLNFLREDFGAYVPPARINAAQFMSVATIAALVEELTGASGAAQLEGSQG